MMRSLTIHNLTDCQEYFQTVCQWLWDEWGKEDGRSIEDIAYRTHHCLGKTDIPMTFVGLLEGMPVGTVSLWRNDLKSRQDLTPWLAVLYVIPELRKKGIGTALQQHVIAEARKMKYSHLYLITDHEGYYEKQGWSFLERAPLYDGRKTRIYSYILN